MQRATQQAGPPRNGRIWRFLTGDPDGEFASYEAVDLEPDEVEPEMPDRLVDVRAVSQPDLDIVYLKVQRLETGIQLISEALKKVYGNLARSIEELKEVTGGPGDDRVERIVADAVEPLSEAVERIAGTTEELPLIIAAATDRLHHRIQTAWGHIEGNVIALMARPWDGSLELDGEFDAMNRSLRGLPNHAPIAHDPNPSSPFRVVRSEESALPATPFDVEPVEHWAEEDAEGSGDEIWGSLGA
jgi:hypothetical protein